MKKHSEILDEDLYLNQLSSGLKCYIIPKAGYVEKQAMLTVCYGSADSTYTVNNRAVQNPEGIAHFLEHKLFDGKDDSLFKQFSKFGGNVNAFTTFNQTAYYVSCVDNFEDNLNLLLDFCQNPHITDESVEKEKGVITQEIQMYNDMASWRAYTNLNAALYGDSPLATNITGSEESIRHIGRQELLDCYNTFYFPSNMALICVGDIDPELAGQLADSAVSPKPEPRVTRGYHPDYSPIKQDYVEIRMPVSMPMFELGFKETDFETRPCTRAVTGKILLDMIAGESSKLYERLYNQNLIDGSFAMDYLSGTFYGISIYSGLSPDPLGVREQITEEIERLKHDGLNRGRFENIKRKHAGRFIKSFNNVGHITHAQADLYTKGLDVFDLMDCFSNITFEEAETRFRRHFIEPALSVVNTL